MFLPHGEAQHARACLFILLSFHYDLQSSYEFYYG